MIIWVFRSTPDHQRFVLPYEMKPPKFPNAIPIILVKEVNFAHWNEYTIETLLLHPHLLSNQGSAGENSSDAIWMLLRKAKSDESIARSSIFIKECRVHPNFLVVLASDYQLEELVQFCTDPQEFPILCADPTFNIFEDNISLTVTT